MIKRNPLHVVLGVIGLAAWLLYVLGCVTSWSPDSSKVLFPYFNPDPKECGIALYDRNTGAINKVFIQAGSGEDCDDSMPFAKWTRGGSSAIVVWKETKEKTRKKKKVDTTTLHVDVLPIGANQKSRHFTLREFEPSDPQKFLTAGMPVETQGKLYLGRDGGSFARLDLQTARKESRELGDSRDVGFVARDSEHIVYERDGPDSKDDLELGVLDQDDLTLHPLFVLKKAALSSYGVKRILGVLAFEPHGSRIAMVGLGEDDKGRIILCTDAGLQKVVTPDIPAKEYSLINLEWSLDSDTLFASVEIPTEDKEIEQYFLGEISLQGGHTRLVQIARGKYSSDGELFDISLSPDGSTIATATAFFDEDDIAPADRGLFLVDLRDPARKVTKIQHPPPPTGNKASEKE